MTDKNYSEIKKCRICGNTNLVPVLDLGEMALSGVFPKTKDEKVPISPLELVKCSEGDGEEGSCGLLQLRHTYSLEDMYGENYGYRSGLNASMVKHLKEKVERIKGICPPKEDDIILDIGSNDSTLLQSYGDEEKGYLRIGIDPTGVKFKKYYPDYISLIPNFFDAKLFKEKFPGKKAKIVTSIAMFYDLEEPMKFVKDIYDVLDDDGVWVFEQSYMPTMIKNLAYDTVCHEHLEYYRLKQILWMTKKLDMKIIDIEFNNINGGSFSVMVAKNSSKLEENKELIEKILDEEKDFGLDKNQRYLKYADDVKEHKEKLVLLLNDLKKQGKIVYGYGASTKGNVVLQYCGIDGELLPKIAEVNKDKFGVFTPGTLIDIVSEEDAKKDMPDYMMVLPWHFKEFIVEKEKDYLDKGGKLLFPLPRIEIVES
jgi:hypothetical protein